MYQEMKKHPLLNKNIWLALIPAIIVLGITPLFIKLFAVPYPQYPVNWNLGANNGVDVFTYGKMHILILSGVLSVLYLFFQLPSNPFRNSKVRKPLVLLSVTSVWLLLTTLTAKFQYTALWGGLEKYEGVFVWLTYLAFACYIGNIAKHETHKLFVTRIILFSGLLITTFGLFQFLSHDLMKMAWFQQLIFPKEVIDSINFTFELNRVYATLYNPNFVAMYVATILPLSLFMIYREKHILFKGLWALFSVLLLINLVGSKSSGGFAGLAIAATILLYLMFIKKLAPRVKKILTITLVSVTSLFIVLFLSGTFNTVLNVPPMTNTTNMTDLRTEGHKLFIGYKDKTLMVEGNSVTLDTFKFYNADNTEIYAIANGESGYKLASPDFEAITFGTRLLENGMAAIVFKIDDRDWQFILHPNGLIYVNNYGTPVAIETAKAAGGFVGHEQFGSARGYIWSRTLPLIQASPIVGYGSDNFVIAFPQNEYLIKYQLYGNPGTVVDKAHCIPLQLAMNFGIPGALLIFAVIGYSVYALYKTKEDTVFNYVVIICIFGYLGSGLFYDSNLHVSPFFWTFVGFGFKDLFNA